MKKLRLLFTEDCDRNCPMCCNKSYDLNSLSVFDIKHVNMFEEIIITGGEPMLKERMLGQFLYNDLITYHGKIYVQTALPTPILVKLLIDDLIDGITLTIHDNRDIHTLRLFEQLLLNEYYGKYENTNPWDIKQYSLRLNVFKQVTKFTPLMLKLKWEIKITDWEKDCPLPKNEIFMRYE